MGQQLARGRTGRREPDRDVCITLGSGSGESYRPSLRMTMGSVLLAHATVRGDLEVAFLNPSALLTQAYRGVGVFAEPLPVCVLACYPSLDRFVFAVHARTGVSSLGQLIERRTPLHVSIRDDATHATRVLIDQTLAAYGVSLRDLEGWGCSFQHVTTPADSRRLAALESGEIDAVFDEGIRGWFPTALSCGLEALPVDGPAVGELDALGWRRVVIPAGAFPNLNADSRAIDFSGWPLYTRASLPDEAAYELVEALPGAEPDIPWEEPDTHVSRLGSDSADTPLDVLLHPGAARWYKEHAT
jgi:TRAP-type uncharacterized transport system substrate-binding protein